MAQRQVYRMRDAWPIGIAILTEWLDALVLIDYLHNQNKANHSHKMSRRTKAIRFACKFFDEGRLHYLKELKNEFEKTNSTVAKKETIANLANFAYNPENYNHLFSLSVHQLFVNNLNSEDDFVSLASLKGLCNLATDPTCATFLAQSEIINKIIACMLYKSDSADFIINTLLLLVTLKQSNFSLDNQLQLKLQKSINQLPEKVKNDTRVNNLYQILFSENK